MYVPACLHNHISIKDMHFIVHMLAALLVLVKCLVW